MADPEVDTGLAPGTSGDGRGRIEVLIAEGNAHLGSVMRFLLESDGRFRVVLMAQDGDSAVAYQQPVDLALVDLSVAGLGAMATIARLRAHRPPPSVIAVSSVDVPYLRHAARQEGAVDFVVKSGDLDRLPDRLAALVADSRA